MYNTGDSAYIYVNDSMKNNILICLVILLVGSLLGGYFLSFSGFFEGIELGRIVFPLFILSEIPILVNYFYFVLTRFGLPTKRISIIFAVYYTPSLMIHSGIYTVVIGLAFAHLLLVTHQSVYCMIFMGVLGLLWIIDYILWSKNWPLYPRAEQNTIFLHWFQWVVLFGLLIGLPIHAKTWSLLLVTVFPTIAFGSLFVVIFQEFRNRRTITQKVETQNPITQVNRR
jgi:hypothetical protein